jgi:hypothetical protein
MGFVVIFIYCYCCENARCIAVKCPPELLIERYVFRLVLKRMKLIKVSLYRGGWSF